MVQFGSLSAGVARAASRPLVHTRLWFGHLSYRFFPSTSPCLGPPASRPRVLLSVVSLAPVSVRLLPVGFIPRGGQRQLVAGTDALRARR